MNFLLLGRVLYTHISLKVFLSIYLLNLPCFPLSISLLLSRLSCEIMAILKYQPSIICVFEVLDGGHLRLKLGGTKTEVMEMLHNY